VSPIPDTAARGDTLESFLDRLGARVPTPGRGSAAALSAALGASLLAMVANYTIGRRFAEVECAMQNYVAELTELRSRALRAMKEDEEAFKAVGGAYGMPQDSDAQRDERADAIQRALIGATEPPMAIASICARLSDIATVLSEKGNRKVLSDVGIAASCAGAALDGALLNVAINAAQISDESTRLGVLDSTHQMHLDRVALHSLVENVRAKVTD